MNKKLILILILNLIGKGGIAQKIFLNGVEITGIKNQTFYNATVTITATGDIYIEAKGYKVERIETEDYGPGGKKVEIQKGVDNNRSPLSTNIYATTTASQTVTPSTQSTLTKKYWLVVQSNAPQLVQWQVEVFINGTLVKTVKSDEQFYPFEVTKYLRPGKNSIIFNAIKDLREERRSTSPSHWYQVIIGEGHTERGTVIIDNPEASITLTASEINQKRKEVILTAE